MLETLLDVAQYVGLVLVPLLVAVRLIAPKTDTTLDDRAATVLGRLHALLVRLLAGKRSLPELPGAE